MRVLSIGSDPNIFDPDSVSAKRMIGYGEMVERYDILARTPRGQEDIQLSEKVHVYAIPAKTPAHAVIGALRRFRKLRRRGPWDVVTAQDPFDSGLAGWMLARLLGAAFHVQVHGDFFGSVHWQKERPLNRVLFPLAVFLVRRADAVRAVSETVRDGLMTCGVAADRIFVSRIGPEIALMAEAEREGSKRFPSLLWVGRFETEKNPLLALRAFVCAREKNPVKMAVETLGFVGQGSLREEMEKEIKQRGLDAVVFVEPWTKTPVEYYRNATAVLLTSNHEGWGRVIEEAGRFARPVIITSVSGAGALVRDGETGFVSPVGDTEAFAEKILFAFSDRERLSLIGKALGEKVRTLPDAEITRHLLYQSWEDATEHFQQLTKPALRRLRSLLWVALAAHALMFFAFLFRFGTGGEYGWYVLGSDDIGYLQIGKNIWHGVFSQSVIPPFAPDYDRMPLYPLLLSLGFLFPMWVVIVLQQVLSLTGILLWYALAGRVASPRIAWWSAVLFSIEPTTRFWTAQVATEALFVPLWFGSLYFFMRFVQTRQYRPVALSGLFFGLATLTRPIVLYYPLLLLMILLWRFWKHPMLVVRASALFAFIAAGCLAPWIAHNVRVFGIPAVSFKGTGIQFYENAPTYLMWKLGVTREQASQELERRLPHAVVQKPEENYLLDAVVGDVMAADPLGYAYTMSKNAIPFFFGDGYAALTSTFFPDLPAPTIRWDGDFLGYVRRVLAAMRSGAIIGFIYVFGKVVTVALTASAVLGIGVLFRDREKRWWVVWWSLTIGYFTATSSTIAYSRYRFPVQPILFCFSVAGFLFLWRYRKRLVWKVSP